MTIGAKPFLKWAGGKGQILPSITELLPTRIQTYYEPFIGGGAIFWHLGSRRGFERAVINDWNEELVGAYLVIRDQPEALIAALNKHLGSAWNTKEYFEEVRKQSVAEMSPIERTARMIYLNKTCFNGLYRVNKKGGFNTPFASYKNPSLFESVNIRACSQVLSRDVRILQGDFREAVANAKSGDVVYFDPPYVPVSKTANFVSYTSDKFGTTDQSRLALTFKTLAERDVSVILSNSDTEVVRKLYEDFEIVPIRVKRHINSKAEGRGPVGEVLVIHRGAAHRASPKFDYSSLGD